MTLVSNPPPLVRSLFAASAVALLLISGSAGATAQPVTTSPQPGPSLTLQPASEPDGSTTESVDSCSTATPTPPPATTTSPPPTSTTTSQVAPCDVTGAVTEQSSAQPTTQTSPPSASSPLSASSAPETSTAPSGKVPYTGLPTENPNSTIIPGKMRSDREEIPGGFTKEQADNAEVREAELQRIKSQPSAARAIPRPGADCSQYWPTEYWVCGAIRDKYVSLGAQGSFLTWPTSEELVNPDGYGRRQTFQNGQIYWSAATGAHPVVNAFFDRWRVHGYEAGWMKYPTSDEIVNADGVGRRQVFQGATIYWHPTTGAHTIGGRILDKWIPNGAALGYPTSDEIWTADGNGRYNTFSSGVIYWHPSFGAHPVRGGILTQWAALGYESGQYGYPEGDQYPVPGGVAQEFQDGPIQDPATPVQNPNPIDWEILRSHFTNTGYDVPLRRGQIRSFPGARDGFGWRHITEKHAENTLEELEAINEIISNALIGCGNKDFPVDGTNRCEKKVPYNTDWTDYVVWTDRVDSRTPDNRPVGVISAWREQTSDCSC